jgi:chymotrypsin C
MYIHNIQQIWILICSKIKKLYFIFQGDSGGPLVCLNNEGHWEVLGVASFGVRGCFTDQIPNIYQSVPHNSDWIAHHTGKYAHTQIIC